MSKLGEHLIRCISRPKCISGDLDQFYFIFFFEKGDLAKHKCFTNWGDYKSTEIRTNQIKCRFLKRGEI